MARGGVRGRGQGGGEGRRRPLARGLVARRREAAAAHADGGQPRPGGQRPVAPRDLPRPEPLLARRRQRGRVRDHAALLGVRDAPGGARAALRRAPRAAHPAQGAHVHRVHVGQGRRQADEAAAPRAGPLRGAAGHDPVARRRRRAPELRRRVQGALRQGPRGGAGAGGHRHGRGPGQRPRPRALVRDDPAFRRRARRRGRRPAIYESVRRKKRRTVGTHASRRSRRSRGSSRT